MWHIIQISEAHKHVSYMSRKIPELFVFCVLLVIHMIVRSSESLGRQSWLTYSSRFFPCSQSMNYPEPFSAANGLNDAVNLMLALEFHLG